MKGLFVTGSDTEVGKTWYCCALIRTLRKQYPRVGAYKPVASGVTDPLASDMAFLWEATGRLESIERVCPQWFTAPLAPPLAAVLERRNVDRELLGLGAQAWRDRCDVLIVEGAGGLLSPLTSSSTNADLACQLGFPVILVVAQRLGAVNQSLLTLEVARSRGLNVVAIVLNETERSIGQHCDQHASMIRQQLQALNQPDLAIEEFSYGETELSLQDRSIPNWLSIALELP